MDKYDELEYSERDLEAEDYFNKQMERAGVETKEKQERLCWAMRNQRFFTGYPESVSPVVSGG